MSPASSADGAAGGTRQRPVRRSAFWWAISKVVVLGFVKVYFRLRVEGRANVPATGPVLVVANHASYLDPPLVGITAGRWVGFLAQAGLAKLGPLRWWLGQMGVTLIDRRAPSKDALRLVADCLAAGEAVGLFPEGTRSADGSVGPFRTGVEFLVRRTGACVVPVGIDGASRALPRRAWLPRPRKVVLRYGEPWPASRVLAAGGVEALRQHIAALANAPLANSPLANSPLANAHSGDSARTGDNESPSPPASAPRERAAADPSSSAGSGA